MSIVVTKPLCCFYHSSAGVIHESFTVSVTVQTETRAPLVPCQAAGPLPQCAVRPGLRDSYGSLFSPPGSIQGLWSSRQDTFHPSDPRLANDHWWWNDSSEFRNTKVANTSSRPTYFCEVKKYESLFGSFTIQLIATEMLIITFASFLLNLNWFLLSFKYVSLILPHRFVKKERNYHFLQLTWRGEVKLLMKRISSGAHVTQ